MKQLLNYRFWMLFVTMSITGLASAQFQSFSVAGKCATTLKDIFPNDLTGVTVLSNGSLLNINGSLVYVYNHGSSVVVDTTTGLNCKTGVSNIGSQNSSDFLANVIRQIKSRGNFSSMT